MATFSYNAKNQYGENVKGRVEAQTREQAAGILRNRGLFVVGLKESGDTLFGFLQNGVNQVKKDEIVNFTRQLATMITAGLTLVEAIAILRQQAKGPMAQVLGNLQSEVEGGSTFAKSLEAQSGLFSQVYIQLVRAGETAGVLDEVLNRLADTLEKQKDFRSKTQGAMIYPIIVIIAMVIVAIVMMVAVVPKLTQMYKDLGARLPLPTQILIDLSGFLANYWWILLIVTVGGVFGFRAWIRTKTGRLEFHTFLLKMPIIGVLREKVLLTEFCRTLGLLLSAGISLLQGLEIMAAAMENQKYQNALYESREQVERGIPLSQALSKYEEFPPLVSQMVAVGEETGKMDDVLLKLSKYFESESEHAVKNLTTAFEPIIMAVLGIGVGLMVMAIILPIYNLTTALS